jgi:hypothetical protein
MEGRTVASQQTNGVSAHALPCRSPQAIAQSRSASILRERSTPHNIAGTPRSGFIGECRCRQSTASQS